MSGCMNACGHHHVGNIGILGVDKNGEEWYQISVGGAQGNDASLGKVIGPSFAAADVPDVIVRLVDVYVENRPRRTSGSSTPCGASASTRSRSASMPQLIKGRAVVDDRWTLLRDGGVARRRARRRAGDRAARVLARRIATRSAPAATSASGSRRPTIRPRSPPTSARCR